MDLDVLINQLENIRDKQNQQNPHVAVNVHINNIVGFPTPLQPEDIRIDEKGDMVIGKP